ncbi:MAG: disulfide bond formation protein B [Acidobacteriota bacterium]|nr:disulfide bond formation protein B [Acidobacteriota bacterium]MDH3530657.1 disulfide bond formation protein B [Acidobacteriota bacterium]
MNSKLNESLPYLAWTIALVSTAGSLFFSLAMELPPCDLCWYQRIALFPLVLIIGTGIVLRDKNLKIYALPLSVFGLAVAFYHNLLYYKLIPQPIVPCSAGVSCTETQLELFGFLTIPLMSLVAFILVTIFLLLYKTKEK